MSKFLAGIAALTLAGAAMMPMQASAAEANSHVATKFSAATSKAVEPTEMSAQRRHWRHRHYGYRHWDPRRHWGPRYGYYRPYPYYGYRAYPYRYYRPGPAVSFGFGPFGFGVF
jgi:hypothetical protein